MEKVLAILLSSVAVISATASDMMTYLKGITDENYVWITTSNGLVRYDKFSGGTKTFTPPTFTNLTALTFSGTGEIVVGGGKREEEVAMFDGVVFSPIQSSSVSFPQNISSLTFHNGLWVGGSGNLIHQTATGWKKYDMPNSFLAEYRFGSLTWSEKCQRMWFGAIGSSSKDNLGYVDATGIYFVREANADINGIIELDDGSLILATEYGLQKYADGKIEYIGTPFSIDYPGITAITQNEDGIWFGMRNKVFRYNGTEFKDYKWDNRYEEDCITDMFTDKDNVIWIVFYYEGLVKFDNGEFTPVTSGISSPVSDSELNAGDIYDLRGLKLKDAPKNQIIIRNGKKYLERVP